MDLNEDQCQYVENWIRSFFDTKLPSLPVPKDLSTIIFYELSRFEEFDCEMRDQWGNWEWPYSESTRNSDLYKPFLDLKIRNWTKSLKGIVLPDSVNRWPEGKSFAICLTHDVDFVSHYSTSISFVLELIYRMIRVPHGQKISMVSKICRHLVKLLFYQIIRNNSPDDYNNFDVCINLEKKYGFTSTFFFFAEHLPAPSIWDCGYSYIDRLHFNGSRVTVQKMIREIMHQGWDVGLHGSYHAATNLIALLEEKRILEKCTGKEIHSIRHHYLHYDARITPSLHEQAGFKNDSTHGFNRNIGFRAGTAFPYLCWDHRLKRATFVHEIPLHITDSPLFTTNGLECNYDMAVKYIKTIMDHIENVGGCLTINWHPAWLRRPNYRAVFEYILEEGSQRNAWGCSIKQLFEWWMQKKIPCDK